MAALEDLAAHIKTGLADAVRETRIAFDELTITVDGTNIVPVLTFLRDDAACEFKVLIDICGVDYPNRPRRFDVVYHLLSVAKNARVRVKLEADETVPVPSACRCFRPRTGSSAKPSTCTAFCSRIIPILRRLLTDYGFTGYPMRKDFPLTGYVEVRYDDEQKRVVYEPVKLVQEFRDFDFLSPWEGAPYIPGFGDKK